MSSQKEGFVRAEHYGQSGSEQGRDIIAYTASPNEQLWYFQCKRYQTISATTLKDEVDKIQTLATHAPHRKPAGIIFVTACTVSAKIRDDVSDYCRARHLDARFWAQTELDMKVKKYPEIIKHFFGIPHNFLSREDVSGLPQSHLRSFDELPTDKVPPPASLPSGSRVSLRSNPLFVGREEDFLFVASVIKGGDTTVINQAVAATGLGGIGKTQLAVEFVHRYGQYFQGGVYWLNFEVAEAIPAEVASCGGRRFMNLLPDFDQLPPDEQTGLVLRAWQEPTPRLLVFDNCEDDALLARWRPISGGCRVLVTSRRSDWDPTLSVKSLPLGVLKRQESIDLLRKYRPDILNDDSYLDKIAAELGDLPLALHLAGSFLSRYRSTIAPRDYLNQLSQPNILQHASLQGKNQRRELSPTLHEQNVARTFALSYGNLDKNDPIDKLALTILSRAARFVPGEHIPYELLLTAAGISPTDQQAKSTAEDAIRRLGQFGLIQLEDEAIRIHRLLSFFVKEVVDDPEAKSDAEVAVVIWATIWNDTGHPSPMFPMLPHLRFLADDAASRNDQTAAQLSQVLGTHLFLSGDYASAQKYCECAVSILQQLPDQNSDELAGAINMLGRVLRARGDLTGAQRHYEKSLELLETIHGADSLATVAALNNQGLALSETDKEKAQACFIRALRIVGDEPESQILKAAVLNNLGLLHHGLGDHAKARNCYEQAFALRSKLLGEEHPETALMLNNLGGLLSTQGDYKGALDYYQRALAIYEKALGEHHPDTARSLHNIGGLMVSAHDPAAAGYFERALVVFDSVFGVDSPQSIDSRERLAELALEHEQFSKAEELIDVALPAAQRAFGQNEPGIARLMSLAADVAAAQGNVSKSLEYLTKSISICDSSGQCDDLAIAQSLTKSGTMLMEIGKPHEAQANLKRAVEIVEKQLGAQHEVTAFQYKMLFDAQSAAGDLEAAYASIARAAELYERALGLKQPSTAQCLYNLAVMLRLRKDYSAAEKIQRRALLSAELIYGNKHDAIIQALNHLAIILRHKQEYADALKVSERALKLAKKSTDDPELQTIITLGNMATIYYHKGDYTSSIERSREALFLSQSTLGPYHPQTIQAQKALDFILKAQADSPSASGLGRPNTSKSKAARKKRQPRPRKKR